MTARSLLTAALLALLGCDTAEPRTAYEARGVYELPPTPDAQAQAQAPVDQKPEPVWPRRFTHGDTTFATYEPLIDAWKNDKLEAHAAVEATPTGATTPKYGLVWFEAPTQTDRERGLVRLGEVRVLRVRFPTATEREAAWLEALRGADLPESRTVSVDRLQRQVAYAASPRAAPSAPMNNPPPIILTSDRPMVLVQVDGPPQLRDDGGVQRVTNTRAVISSDRGSFYVWVADRWFRASAIDGAYSETQDVPPALVAAKDRLAKSQNVELFTDSTERVRYGATVLVATKPTEVIETRGAPVYEPIPGANVSYVSNTETDVLRDEASGQTYALLSAGWFRALTLGGPWTYVPGPDVPASFRQIPRDHREARVLASIPNTPEAEEAEIAATIPQTATVDRGRAQLAVAYEGDPDFRPVEGTSAPLRYAVNASTPVITTGDGLYYAVENGVWFVAPSPTGPWSVASTVPEAIYTIPQSSPIHYVTYVRVYGYSPDYVYVGYLPGYIGAYYTGAGIVFGAGFGYPYPYRPYGPWFGPSWYGAYGWYGGPRVWGPGWGWRGPTAIVRGNVYQRWSPSVVRAPAARVMAPPARVMAPPATGPLRVPAAPSVGRQPAPRTMAPASPYVGPRAAPPSVRSPASPSYAPRAAPPSVAPPSIRSPASPSYVPRAAPPPVRSPSFGGRPGPYSGPAVAPPRMAAPPSVAPRVGPSMPSGGAMRSGPAIRSAPPMGGPSMRSGPAVRSAPPAVRGPARR